MFLMGCSKDDEPKSTYTIEQQNALNIMNGQFKNDFLGKRFQTIKFNQQFEEPKPYKYALGYDEYTTMDVQGLMEYYYYEDKNTMYHCGYSISDDGLYMTEYMLNENNVIYKSEKLKITIVNQNQFKTYSEYGDGYNPSANVFDREN